MKKTIKITVITICIIIGLIVAAICALPLRMLYASWHNGRLLNNLTEGFVDALEDGGIEVIEYASIHGKLNGNGNGISYFGAALINADDEDLLDAVLEKIKGERYKIVEYSAQKGQAVVSSYLEHGSITFKTHIENGKYIIVFFFTDHPKSDMCDLAGH